MGNENPVCFHPQAVADDAGEWLELLNADASAVNLRDWVLRDDGNDRHRIAADLHLQPHLNLFHHFSYMHNRMSQQFNNLVNLPENFKEPDSKQ
mgnify:CR=1 FL=1